MAAPTDISSILAALAAQRPASVQGQTSQPAPPAQVPSLPRGLPPGFPPSLTTPTPPAGIPGYQLPNPSGSGTLDLSAIRPVNSGNVSFGDAIAKARGFAAERGFDGRSTSGTPREDPRLAQRAYDGGRRRSRSRSPPRRDTARDNYNPYRDERRDDRRSAGYGRERSRSPAPRGREPFSPPRAYGRDRTPEADNEETIIIDHNLVGLVIGRQGENLKRIEHDTKTRIQFMTGPEASGQRRQCRISGPPRARAEAKHEINRILEENGGNPPQDAYGNRGSGQQQANRGRAARETTPVLREGENQIQIMVPDKTVGLIIGRGGETIRDLQDRSGCHVNIVGENKSVNGLRPVNLIGTPEAAAAAKAYILDIVESDTRASGQKQDQGRGNGFDGYGGQSQGGDKITETIHVPSGAVGMIIGKGGETIKDMQNTTGCKINVTQASGADIEREIGLVGSRQAIESAKRAIWDKVDTVEQRERGGGGRGGGRGGRDDNFGGDRYSQQQPSYGQSAPNQGPPAGAPAADGADPYAAWGGYQNYLAMWYAAMAQQSGAQPGAGPPAPPAA